MLSNLQQSLNKYKWEIGLTALGLVMAGGIFWHRSRPQLVPILSPVRSQISQDQLISSTDQFFDKNAQMIKVTSRIQISDPENLSFNDIKMIYEGSLDIMKDQYIKFTKEVRKRRRLIRKINEDQYLNMVIDYENKVKELLQRGRLQLIANLQISADIYQQSVFQMHQQYHRQQFYRLQQMCQKLIKEKMLKKRRMSDKTAKQILRDQLKFLKSKLYQRYQKTLKKKQTKINTILHVIHTIIQDLIYQKYGFEEEHLIFKRLDQRFCNLEDVKYLVQSLQKQQEILMGQIVGYTPVYDQYQ